MHQKFFFRLLLFLLLPTTLLAADISFDSARRDFATDGGGSVAIGDFNSDGQLDLATASFAVMSQSSSVMARRRFSRQHG